MKKSIVLFVVMIISSCPVAADEYKTGSFSGKVMMKDGGPLTGGIVSFYRETSGPPPAPEKYWRVPDLIADIDEEGRFSADLDEGNYYIEALQKLSGGNVGPPEEGDYFFISRDSAGKPRMYAIRTGDSKDIGVFAEVVPFHGVPANEISGVEGTVISNDGKPVKGAIVFAFPTSEMVGQALFVSNRTEKDGRYVLRVHEDGTYYLAVRDAFGGGPPEGGVIISGHSTVTAIVKKGETTKRVDIKVHKDHE